MSGGKKARLVLLLMIGLTAGAQAADSQKTYEYDRDQFSITLPAEWVEIPTTEITAFVDDLSKRAPEAPAQDYQYGFQLEESEYWFEYPYILIQIGREGRVNEDYLMGLKKLGNPNEEDRLNNAMKGVASNFSLEEAVYDPLKHIVWSRINAVLNDGRKVSAILGEVLAENGYILISLGCLSDRVDSYKDTFSMIVESVILSDDIRYRSNVSNVERLSKRTYFGPVVPTVVFAAVVGFIVWWISYAKERGL